MKGAAAKQQGDAAMAADYRSADAAERSAADAIERGKLKDLQVVMRASRMIVEARVLESSRGAVVGVGASAAVQAGSEAVTEVDRKTVARNALMEAYGLRARAQGFRQEGVNAKAAGENAMLGTFLSGAAEIGSKVGAYAADYKSPEDSVDSTPDQVYRDSVLREEH